MGNFTNKTERLAALDVLRGFALFGIFFVNWPSMVGIETFDNTRTYTGSDAYLRLAYDLLIQTKFYTIFSFLFGLGFYLFITKAEQHIRQPRLLFLRRLAILFVFGLLHYVLLWGGDILHSYAIAGILLLLFYKRQPKIILIWSIILLSFFQLLMLLIFIVLPVLDNSSSTVHEIIGLHPLQNWTEQVIGRWERFFGEDIVLNILYIPETVGLFLLGLLAGKIQLLYRVQEWRQPLRIIQTTAFLLTLPSWYMIVRYFISVDEYDSAQVYIYVLLSGKTLFVFYTVTIIRLMQHPRWQRTFQPLQYTGRLALTNYLTQTICTTLLFGVFLPNSPQLPLVVGLLFCIVLYSLQLIWSRWWLQRFSYGPFEYIWRLGTYGRHGLRKKQRQ